MMKTCFWILGLIGITLLWIETENSQFPIEFVGVNNAILMLDCSEGEGKE